VAPEGGRARLSWQCGGAGLRLSPDVEVVGPIAFSPAGDTVYFASPDGRGFVDLWRADLASRRATRMTAFARDTYAPSVAADGTVLFRVQSYRTHVAELDLASGASPWQLATFQSETPSYHPDGRAIAVTYGTWRRVIDDARYPDIAQEIGLVRAGGRGAQDAPFEVVARSDSEDQAMAWSPNGRWIAFHSHREQSDDVWLRPADGSRPDRRVSFLGRGAEVGWPRWSPDGTAVAFGGASPHTGQGVIFTLPVDQDTGAPGEAREVAITGVEAEWTAAEWLPDSRTLVALGKTGPGQHAIVSVPAAGGPATVLRRIATEHDFPGLAVSPDGARVAFVQRADDGWFQVFGVRLDGRDEPLQLTRDAGHKTQPAWAPDGQRVAYTVWGYDAQFWAWRPAR
jgi:Tol biopolymer transport system component